MINQTTCFFSLTVCLTLKCIKSPLETSTQRTIARRSTFIHHKSQCIGTELVPSRLYKDFDTNQSLSVVNNANCQK